MSNTSEQYAIVAQQAQLGLITRDFAKALDKFTNISGQEVESMLDSVRQFGIQGNDELPRQIRKTLQEKISIIENDVQKLRELIPKLEKAAKGYDEVILKLMESLGVLK